MAAAVNERVFLTTHRTVWIAERRLVLSSSVEITRHKQTEAELFQRAYFDDLTGLPNRKLIEQHADHLLSLRDAPRFALAFLDIDNFKHINDYYGHAAGDALLVEVAKRLSRDLRRTDTLSQHLRRRIPAAARRRCRVSTRSPNSSIISSTS